MKSQFLSPRWIFAYTFVLLLAAIQFGMWQVATSGEQVRVPMFYDAHYAYQRPWTQAQEVPDRPNRAPIALYQNNQLSQTWISHSDRLSMVSLWMWGSDMAYVKLSVAGNTYAQ
ncbi:MAG TPA: hypothetical protein ENJ56_04230, partial [Anaerolineae bacterium]|nr:hypothetical protein [Anaerolineae bacterium]